MIMLSKPSAPISTISDPGDYTKNNLSGAWLLQKGFKALKPTPKSRQLYALPINCWPNWHSTLYMVENKTRIRNFSLFWYSAFLISTNNAGISRVSWRKESYSSVCQVNTLIRTIKNGKN